MTAQRLRCAPGSARAWFLFLASACAVLLAPSVAAADDDVKIVRVEEKWELVVAEPDVDTTAPQVTCVTSPTGDLSSIYLTLELNHQSLPDFTAGGVHMLLWNGGQLLGTQHVAHTGVLNTPGEVIRWTSFLEVRDGTLTLGLRDGSSDTWQSFGQGESDRFVLPTALTNLNGYLTQVSTRNSGISFAANRVNSLIITRVRAWTDDEDEIVDNEPKVVFQRQ